METPVPSKGRLRSKSVAKNADEETTPNVNGSKDGGKEKSDEVVTPPAGVSNSQETTPTKVSRKGKTSDTKMEDGKSGESLLEKDAEQKEEAKATVDDKTESESKNIELPAKQVLGKGKRARIPNKRYSDILVTPVRMDKTKKMGNGEFVDNLEKSSDGESGGSPTQPLAKKQKLIVDIASPSYKKPFQLGWKRELVYRATSDSSLKRNADIYYYTPSGKKVRSMREVSENLKNKELTLDNFTFYKEPIGLNNPEKEIIREAKLKYAGKEASPKVVKPAAPKTPAPSTANLTTTESVAPPANAPAQPVDKPKTTGKNFKVKLPNKEQTPKGKTADKKTKEGSDMEVATFPPTWPTKKLTKWGNSELNDDNKQPCSIRCENVWKPIPSLQCRVCLCLYHNECVGISPFANIDAYVCKTCELRQQVNTGSVQTTPVPSLPAPSLATPINTPNMGALVNTAPVLLPKLQRMPKQSDTSLGLTTRSDQDFDANTHLPKLTPKPGLLTSTKLTKYTDNCSVHPKESKSLVGSVTTWFPPSSTIQVGDKFVSNNIQSQLPVRPQFIGFLGNKKFLIVPKHNTFSISQDADSVCSRPEDMVSTPDSFDVSSDTTSGDNNPTEVAKVPDFSSASTEVGETCDIKVEPPNSPLEEPSYPDPTLQTDTVRTPSPPLLLSEPKMQIEDSIQQMDMTTSDMNCPEQVANIEETTRSSAKNKPVAKVKPTPSINEDEKHTTPQFMDNYLQNLAYGYKTLLYVFQYLKVQDLLRAGCVCTMWRDITNHPLLWKTVRMKNSQIHSFDGLADAMRKHNTVHLDLRKMLLPSGGDEIWPAFSNAIAKVDSLRQIELCKCPAAVVEQLAISNPKLEVINAITIKCESMSLEPFGNVSFLQELRLKSTIGLVLSSDLSALKKLHHLKHLSLTSIKDLNKLNIEVVSDLTNLESLELGECTDFSSTFGPDILTKLTKLEKLRLEKGQGTCNTFEMLDAVKNMPHLEQLELVNFDIKAGFDKALGACTNIKKLLIIPTYISQSATTNHMVLGGVSRLQSTLSHFVWGVTLELLRVTELFVDQCDDTDKKEKKKPVGNGDSIPVLKPVPLLGELSEEVPPQSDPPQVEILPLPNLQKLLLQNLPTTRVKILKIPFHATWRQTIMDTVN